MIATGDKFAVFPAPTDKAIVKPVDGKRIAAEKAHIASFDAFVFAVAFSACQFGQTTAAQGGKPFFYSRAEHGQGRQIAFVQNILRFIRSQNHAGTLYQTALSGNLQMIGDKRRIQDHIAVNQHNIIAFRLRQRTVARFGGTKTSIRLP